jgi:hypothetical protein
MAMVCELAKRIKERSGGAPGTSGPADFHPAFVWLLRDFQLQLSGAGAGASTPRAYLEEALSELRGGGGDEGGRNEVGRGRGARGPVGMGGG